MMESINFNAIEKIDEDLTAVELSEIRDYVAQGEYHEAANLSHALLRQGHFDVRPTSYYLFGLAFDAFEETAVEVCQHWQIVLAQYDSLKPIKYKEKQIKNTIDWFFKTLMDRLDYREAKGSRLVFPSEAVEAVTALEASFPEVLGEISDAYLQVRRFISDRLKVDVQEEEGSADDDAHEGQLLQNADEFADASSASFQGRFDSSLSQSSKWLELLDKLQVLDQLQSQKAYVESAVMYRHIYHLLENFNPMDYFPEYFTDFYQKAIQADFKDIISKTESHISTAQWMALDRIAQSNHRHLLSVNTNKSEPEQVSRQHFRSLIETDEYRDNPPQSSPYPDYHAQPMGNPSGGYPMGDGGYPQSHTPGYDSSQGGYGGNGYGGGGQMDGSSNPYGPGMDPSQPYPR